MKDFTSEKIDSEFSFSKPAVYKIKVQGLINESRSEVLGGMQITVDYSKGKKPISILVGRINDQTALSGILTTLYDFHFPIISVNALQDDL